MPVHGPPESFPDPVYRISIQKYVQIQCLYPIGQFLKTGISKEGKVIY